ncbi:MAG TPA: TrmH family RNA methyltransferase [Candidatus Marinimicrobia bacterium]|nr:TrmH family RNA methyltransferase [Candidatus Neomarinimicrobiota bacterium]
MIKKTPNSQLKASRPGIQDLTLKNRLPITVIADNIRSIYNVGSIFRSSDAAGIEKLILSGITATPPHPQLAKTSLGAELSVSWEYHRDALPLLESLKEQKIPLIALEHTNESVDFQNFSYPFPLAVLIGNEVEGVSDSYLGYCQEAVEIPMAGLKQSLNVAVAYGIFVYELRRQFLQRF